MTKKEYLGVYLLNNTGVMYMLCIICTILAAFISFFMPDSSRAWIVLSDLLHYMFLGFIIVIFGSFLKIWPLCSFHKTKFKNFLICLLLSVPVFYLLNTLNVLMSSLMPRAEVNVNFAGRPFWYIVILHAALPAIFEEIIFRGFILHTYKLRSFTTGLIISALAFAMYHMSFTSFVYTFMFGTIAAYICEITGTIWCSIALHFLNNFYTLFCWQYQDNALIQHIVPNSTISCVIVGIICFAIVCFGLYKLSGINKWCDNTEVNKTYPLLPMGYIIGLIITMVVMVLTYKS